MIKPIILSALLSILLLIYFVISPRQKDEERSETKDRELQMKEYETLNKEIERRERSMIMMGSIFLPASFLILVEATKITNSNTRFFLVLMSIALYSVWLFAVQLTSWWLNEITYARLHWLEKEIGFDAHNYMKRKTRGSLAINIRRSHWAIF